VQYNVGGGGWTDFAINGYITDDFTSAVALQTGLSGSTLRLQIIMYNDHNSEYYYADNIVVQGTLDVWTGESSTDWNTVSNWYDGSIPTSSDDVTIPDGCTYYPVVDETAECNNLTIEDGSKKATTKLTINTGANLTVNGNLQLGRGSGNCEFEMNDGTCTVTGNYYTEIGATTDMNGGTFSFTNWYRNAGTVWSKGTIELSGGTINASGSIVWSSFDVSGEMTGPFIVNIGETFRADGSLFTTITGGTFIMDGSANPGDTVYCYCGAWGTGNYLSVYNLTFDDGGAGNTFSFAADDAAMRSGIQIVNDFNVDNGSVITYNGAGYAENFTVGGDFTVAPGSDVSSDANTPITVTGDFTLESNASGYASWIDDGTFSVTGTTTVELYLTEMKWHFVSPPISNAKLGVFHLPAGYSNIFAKYWVEPIMQWVYIDDVNLDLNVMQGYGIWVDNDPVSQNETIEFKGTLNNNVTAAYTLTNTNDNGWNWVGNPYPSALDWDALSGWTKTDMDNTIYYWNPASGSGNYSYYVGSGTAPWTGDGSVNDGTQYVPAMQGFLVHCNNVSGGSIKIENGARVHNSQAFYKNTENYTDFLKLKAVGNGYWDETLIRFFEGATEGFDSDYDAYKLYGLDEAPQLYSIIPDEVLSVNSLPGYDEDRIVDLGFECGVPEIFTIEASEIESFDENTTIYLEDLKEGVMHNLSENPSYAFAHEIGDDPNRFLLHFGEPSSIDETNQQNVRIYSNEDVVYIHQAAGIKGEITIYDMIGREILSQKISDETLSQIKITEGTGYYLVTLQTEKFVVVEKVFIK